MDLKEILFGGGGAFLILCTMVQISPIRFNPWRWIAKRLGRAINGEVIEKVDNLEKEVTSLANICEEREATTCRTRIIRFGDEMYHSQKHSKEHFDQILADIKTYEDYCGTHPGYRNNIATATINRIRTVYEKCMEEKDFL